MTDNTMKTNANYITLSLSQILFIALITLLAPNINAEIKKEHKIEDNGFEWYKLWDTSSGSEGAIVDGRTIIPLERRYYIIYWSSESGHPDGGYLMLLKTDTKGLEYTRKGDYRSKQICQRNMEWR
ncbi:MAG: hypothetical protein J6A20_11525 [Muribaculaceae bacterium]|nr:hypothetical protein [Muribaculaceae bacterium]